MKKERGTVTVEKTFEIDLDEFDDDELIIELKHRITTNPNFRRTNSGKELVKILAKMMEIRPPREIKTLPEKMMFDYFIDNMDKISLTDLENIVAKK